MRERERDARRRARDAPERPEKERRDAKRATALARTAQSLTARASSRTSSRLRSAPGSASTRLRRSAPGLAGRNHFLLARRATARAEVAGRRSGPTRGSRTRAHPHPRWLFPTCARRRCARVPRREVARNWRAPRTLQPAPPFRATAILPECAENALAAPAGQWSC